jgi:glycosyltransferase involved in cell wall biosynthesis
MSLLEAQAAGVPVLTNRVTGTIDAVRSGAGGFFAEMDSIRDWVEKIESFVADPEMRRQTGRRGRTFVMERFDRTNAVALFADYLAGLIDPGEHGGRSATGRREVSGK